MTIVRNSGPGPQLRLAGIQQASGSGKSIVKDQRAFAILINLPLTLITCLLPRDLIFDWLWLVYLTQMVVGLLIVYAGSDKRISNLFAPSIITFVYFGMSFFLGSYCVFYNVSLKKNILTPEATGLGTNIELIVLVTMIGQMLLVVAALKGTRERAQQLGATSPVDAKARTQKSGPAFTVSVVSVVIFLVFSFIPFDLSMIGAAGSGSYAVRLTAAIALFTASLRMPVLARLAVILFIIAASALQSYESKREIIFVLLAAAMIEMTWLGWKVRFTIKQILVSTSMVTAFIVLILWSSILRGYGNYKPDSAIDALTYVPTYVGESYFLGAANENFELAHVFGNTGLCIALVHDGTIPCLYGSTFAKVLVVPIPRRFWENKPKNMIDIYTKVVAPNFHAVGGSVPVSLFGELFANFHLLGLALVYPLFRGLDLVFLEFQRRLYSGQFTVIYFAAAFFSATTIQFARGSGLDMHLIYVFIPMPFMLMFSMLGRGK